MRQWLRRKHGLEDDGDEAPPLGLAMQPKRWEPEPLDVSPVEVEQPELDVAPVAQAQPAPVDEDEALLAEALGADTSQANAAALAQAEEADARTRLMGGMGNAAREAIGALTRTRPTTSRLAPQAVASTLRQQQALSGDVDKRRRAVLDYLQNKGLASYRDAMADATRRLREREAEEGPQKLALEREKLDARKREQQLRAEEAGKARTENALEREAKRTEAETKDTIGFMGKRLLPPPGGADATAANELRRKAGAVATAVSTLREMAGLYKQLASNPGDVELRGRLRSMTTLVAQRINVAQGQGAMANEEFARMKESVGDPSAPSFWLDAIETAISDGGARTLARLKEAERYFLRDMRGAAQAAGYRLEGE
jgi:hypothetical protein